MLTKDLLRHRSKGDYIKPLFIEASDRNALELAENLCAVFNSAQGASLGSIEETVFPLLHSVKDLKLSKGLYKVLSDSCEFKLKHETDFALLRESVFKKSAELLGKEETRDYRAYREAILARCNDDEKSFIRNGIYADMPENEILSEVPGISPQELLLEYNVALVRSLVFFCTGMTLKVTGHDPAKMRRLFRCLKFFRLIASVFYAGDRKFKNTEELPASVIIRIGGPASIFENSRKYGLQISSFLPSVFAMEQWEMDCRLELGGKERKMKLSNADIQAQPSRMMRVYVPEEIKLFSEKFKEQYPDWTISPGEPVFDSVTREIIFPDFSFRRTRARGQSSVFHLELFHRWHGTQIPARLAFLKTLKKPDYILGIDNSLASKDELKAQLESSGMGDSYFTFRDYPLPSKLVKILEAKYSS